MKKCKVNNCNGKHKAKGYCSKHYQQYLRCGEILDRTCKDLNEIVIYEDYAEIVIYNRQCEEIARALINLDDIDKIKDYKWYLDSKGYVYNTKVGLLHRFIMDCPSDKVVDHINHNSLDNRKSNLRVCSIQQNMMNQQKQKRDTTSQYKGCYWSKKNKKWHARIKVNDKHKHIGLYDSEETAAIAYDKAAILHFGEFAFTNFPIENYIDYILDLGLNPNDFNIDESAE